MFCYVNIRYPYPSVNFDPQSALSVLEKRIDIRISSESLFRLASIAYTVGYLLLAVNPRMRRPTTWIKNAIVYMFLCMTAVTLLSMTAFVIDIHTPRSASIILNQSVVWSDYSFQTILFVMGELEAFLMGLLARACLSLARRFSRFRKGERDTTV